MPTKKMNPRARTLYYLGFATYQAYLRSALWRSIRVRVFKQKGHTCSLCSRRATQVHHRSYDRLTLRGAILTYLEPICRYCHQKIEVYPSGRKRARRAVEAMFKVLKRKKLAR
jgi:5-methylcytosine-specific restriction endonuclease McrA